MVKAQKLVIVVIAILLGLVISEVGLRIFVPQETKLKQLERYPPIYTNSNFTSYEIKPNVTFLARSPDGKYVITINSHGTRGKEFNNDRRVLLLGDSQTFGQGLHDVETVGALLEDSSGYFVINAGVPGWGPDQEALQFVRKKDEWKPEVVFWLVFLGNDIEDVGRHSRTYVNGSLVYVNEPNKYVAVDGRAMHNVSKTVGTWWNTVSFLQAPFADYSHLYALIKKVYVMNFVQESGINTAIYTLNDAKHASWQKQTQGIVGETIKNSDVPVFLVLLPGREMYVFNGTDAMNESRRQWRAYANQNLIPLIDTYDVLDMSCYLPLDGHFNEKGAERIAQQLNKYLEAS